MSAERFMSPSLITAPSDQKVSDALMQMCKHRIHNLPVMDEEGNFIGLFGLRNLLHALLPKAATITPALENLDFLADNLEEVVECLEVVADQPVKEFVDQDNVIVCQVDAPIMEVIRQLYEAPSSLPVVLVKEDGTHLVGMISHWDILAKLAAQLLQKDERFDDGCFSGNSDEDPA